MARLRLPSDGAPRGTGRARLAVSGDGRYVAAASGDRGEIWVWDSRTWQVIRRDYAGSRVLALAFGPGSSLLTIAARGECSAWPLPRGEPSPFLPDTGRIGTAAIGGSGAVAAIAYRGQNNAYRRGKVVVWSVRQGLPLRRLGVAADEVYTAAFDAAAERVVTGQLDGSTRVWRVDRGRAFPQPGWHDGIVSRASFSRDGRWLVTAGLEGTVHVSQASTGRLLKSVALAGGVVEARLTPDARWLVIGRADGRLEVHDPGLVVSGRQFTLTTGAAEFAGGTLPGKPLAAAIVDDDGGLWAWKVGKEPQKIETVRGKVVGLAINGDGSAIAVAERSGRLRRVSMLGAPERPAMQLGSLDGASFSSRGDRSVVVTGGRAFLVDLRTGAREPLPGILGGDRVALTAVSRSGAYGAAASTVPGGRVYIWDLANGNLRARPRLQNRGAISALAFGPGETRLAVGFEAGAVTIVELDGRIFGGYFGHRDPINSISFNPDGELRRYDGRSRMAPHLAIGPPHVRDLPRAWALYATAGSLREGR